MLVSFRPMDLRTYFGRTKAVTPSKLAKDMGVSAEIVRLWALGERKPKPENVDKIIEITGGKVTRSGLRPDLYPPRKRAA